MNLIRNRRLGLLFTLVLVVIEFIVACSVFFDETLSASGWQAAGAAGSLTMVSSIVLFIAFSVIDSDTENFFLLMLHFIFGLVGLAIILVVGGLMSLIYSGETASITGENEFKLAFAACWFPAGVLSFFLYYIRCDDDYDKAWAPFINIISIVISYFVCLAFIYLANVVGFFFRGWIIFIISILGFIFVIYYAISDGTYLPRHATSYSGTGGNGGNNGKKKTMTMMMKKEMVMMETLKRIVIY